MFAAVFKRLHFVSVSEVESKLVNENYSHKNPHQPAYPQAGFH